MIRSVIDSPWRRSKWIYLINATYLLNAISGIQPTIIAPQDANQKGEGYICIRQEYKYTDLAIKVYAISDAFI